MRRFFEAQKCNWMRTAQGDFNWSGRMGSGFDPRAERCNASAALRGSAPLPECQVGESAYDRALPAYRHHPQPTRIQRNRTHD